MRCDHFHSGDLAFFNRYFHGALGFCEQGLGGLAGGVGLFEMGFDLLLNSGRGEPDAEFR